jgi:hypothetical protein
VHRGVAHAEVFPGTPFGGVSGHSFWRCFRALLLEVFPGTPSGGSADRQGKVSKEHARAAWRSSMNTRTFLAQSNPCLARPRSRTPLKLSLSWQLRTIVLITLLGPPTASLLLLAIDYYEYWQDVHFQFTDFLIAFLFFAVPVGYVFGTVPALLAAFLYCAIWNPGTRLHQRIAARACIAAVCGGIASWAWFSKCLDVSGHIYGLSGALVMAALSLRLPLASEP